MSQSWRRTLCLRRLKRDQSGVAAIEFAIIMPLLMLIFIGLFDITALLSDNRRLTYSSNVVADLVTRLASPVTKPQMDDIFKAAQMIAKGGQIGDLRVEVHNYKKQGSSAVISWKYNNGVGSACTAPSTASLFSLMGAGNDVVVAVTCTTYTPLITNFISARFMGNSNLKLREQFVMRPRYSLTLACPTC